MLHCDIFGERGRYLRGESVRLIGFGRSLRIILISMHALLQEAEEEVLQRFWYRADTQEIKVFVRLFLYMGIHHFAKSNELLEVQPTHNTWSARRIWLLIDLINCSATCTLAIRDQPLLIRGNQPRTKRMP